MTVSPEQIALILGALGAGGVLIKVIDVLFQGFKDSQRARGLDAKEEFSFRSEIAFWSEKLQETRELYLKEGGDPEKLGPPPRFPHPNHKKENT